jgi:hypothetical protein
MGLSQRATKRATGHVVFIFFYLKCRTIGLCRLTVTHCKFVPPISNITVQMGHTYKLFFKNKNFILRNKYLLNFFYFPPLGIYNLKTALCKQDLDYIIQKELAKAHFQLYFLEKEITTLKVHFSSSNTEK